MIDVNHITKEFVSARKYPGFKGAIKGLFSNEKIRKVAVDDISFHINKGEIVGYIGSNGAGKSTTIKMMTGILNPTKGSCLIGGIDPSKNRKDNAGNIGVVFGQRTQLWWDLPLSESFTILKEIYGVSDRDYKERMEFLDHVLSLEEFFHRPVRTLSLGQRMRADLGAALLHNPKVLYLDEPTIGLDIVVKDKIREAIKEINAKNETTVVLTTHDIDDIEELCSRIIVIDNGKLIYDGSLSALKDTYGTRRRVSIEVKKPQLVLAHDFDVRIPDFSKICTVEKEESDEKTITFGFDKNRLQVSDILAEVMSFAEVGDIHIHETELSEIVKEIYSHKISQVNPCSEQK